MSQTGKPTETESGLVVSRGGGEGGWALTAKGYGTSFGGDENLLRSDGGDGSTTLFSIY